MINSFFNYSDVFVKGVNIGIGVYNLLNQNEWFIQPYNSLHAPLPGLSREFSVKIIYDLVKK